MDGKCSIRFAGSQKSFFPIYFNSDGKVAVDIPLVGGIYRSTLTATYYVKTVISSSTREKNGSRLVLNFSRVENCFKRVFMVILHKYFAKITPFLLEN